MSSAESLRVLVVPSSYFAGERTVGGGERYALEYSRALARLTSTTLGLFDVAADPASRDEEDGGLRTRILPITRRSNGLLFPLTTEGRSALRDFDVVHLMVFPTPMSDLLILLGRLRGQTVVLTDVGGGIPSFSTYLQRLHPRLGVSRLADGLALLSGHSATQFDDWHQPKVVLYGGADARGARAEPVREDVEPYALFVGRLLPHKGVLELIEAIDPEIPLRIVGRPYDAGYVERLRLAAEGKRVSFHLAADDAELRRHYAGARVVLQPSLPVTPGTRDTSELLGLVTLEGMTAGKPVIVTRAGSLPELVRDGVTGFVVTPGDRTQLGERIRRLMDDPRLAASLGAAGRRLVEERFAWDAAARRGLDFYRDLRERH